MINPQSMTLIQAYEPYLAVERVMFLDASYVGYLQPEFPDTDKNEWFWLFTFDSGHKEVNVMCRGFETVDNARAALFYTLWNANAVIRVGGVTDHIPQHDYAVLLTGMRGKNV